MNKNNTLATILKLAAGAVAVAGIAFLVVKYFDAITNWLRNLCPKCKCEGIAEEDFAEEIVSSEIVEEDAPVEEAPVEEAAPIAEGEPVAEENDFEA